MKTIFFLSAIIFFAGCSTKGHKNLVSYNEISSPMINALLSHYQEWRGTRYQLGGKSRRGVDCSGFVYVTYLKQFNLELPRTTINQIRAGKTIDKRELQAGDLVFFKTKPQVRHVGIYLNNHKFMHASSSKGVRISSLNNRYWKKRYWFAKHIPELDQWKNEALASIY